MQNTSEIKKYLKHYLLTHMYKKDSINEDDRQLNEKIKNALNNDPDFKGDEKTYRSHVFLLDKAPFLLTGQLGSGKNHLFKQAIEEICNDLNLNLVTDIHQKLTKNDYLFVALDCDALARHHDAPKYYEGLVEIAKKAPHGLILNEDFNVCDAPTLTKFFDSIYISQKSAIQIGFTAPDDMSNFSKEAYVIVQVCKSASLNQSNDHILLLREKFKNTGQINSLKHN